MKKSDIFESTDEVEIVFDDFKVLFFIQSVFIVSFSKEFFFLYIAVINYVVSTVFRVEREEEGKVYKVQRSVYYVFEVLIFFKQRYFYYQKFIYEIYMTAKKVVYYF